jgi:glycosyltransferase involved in cell wall biosynthesis
MIVMNQKNEFEIGYILKGYPRLSETFIINEIYLLEKMGLKLHLFSLKNDEKKKSHGIVSKIKALITYLPEVSSVSDSPFLTWLRTNLPQFISSHWQLFRLRPKAYSQTLLYTFHLSLKYRSGFWPGFKKVFFKDFLRAGYIALKVLESGRIRHLHGHFCHGATTITMFVSRLTGLPFSFTAHAKDIYLPNLNPGDLLSTKIKQAQFVATCTGANRSYLEQLCPDGSPIHTIYHGLDITFFEPGVRRADPQQPPLILSVGRFVEKKGFAYLVKACRLLKDKGLEFKCRIVGQADDQTELIKQLIAALGLEDTISLGKGVSQEELRQIYQEATIFALPCQIIDNGDRDGIPNVLVEAMAMALPVVSTHISGIPELIDHQHDGWLVPQKDANALAWALEELLLDSALRDRLGQAARQKVCHLFDSAKTTEALKALFLTCLEPQPSQSESYASSASLLPPVRTRDVDPLKPVS